MDFNSTGMNWVVNLCQKMETVYIEMEDKLCQEAKYVESHVQTVGVNVKNQVQTVGANVKNQVQTVGVNVNKYFAEVMQDLLPPSCMALVEEKVPGSSPVKNHDAIYDDHIERTQSDQELGKIAPVGKDSCKSSSSCKECDVYDVSDSRSSYAVNLFEDASSLKSPEENNVLEISEPSTAEDHFVKTEKDACHLTEGVVPVRDQASSSNCPQNGIYLDPESSSDPAEWVDSKLSMQEDEDILIYKQSCVKQEENTINVEAPIPEASAIISALNDMSASSFFSELSDIDHEKACVISPMKLPPTASVKDTGHESSPQSGIFHDSVVDAIDCVSNVSSSLFSHDLDYSVAFFDDLESGLSNSGSMSLAESKVFTGSSDVNTIESCTENIELFDDVKLGDSCVVVDNRDLIIPLRLGPRRSFKKTLQHALASRMRSTKQREYEQLAILYGDIDADVNLRRESSTSYIPVTDLQSKKLSANDLSESDWELV